MKGVNLLGQLNVSFIIVFMLDENDVTKNYSTKKCESGKGGC